MFIRMVGGAILVLGFLSYIAHDPRTKWESFRCVCMNATVIAILVATLALDIVTTVS